MKTITHDFLGGAATPQDIKDLRQSSFDFHQELGYPILFKHRWTLKDFREGLVARCPHHDDLYQQDFQYDNVCFGTGFVGGYRDAEIVYVSLSDAPVDTIKILPNGILSFDQHPQLAAPWLPYMQEGDLIIMATFDPDTWEVMDIGERYALKAVNQVTMRGPGYRQHGAGRNSIGKPYIVHQETTVDKLPYGHRLYDVPLVFDPNSVDPDITPPDQDPDEPGTVGTYAETSVNVRIRGAEQRFSSSVSRALWVDVVGEITSVTSNLKIEGEGEGVEFHW